MPSQGKAAKTEASPDAVKKPTGETLSKAEMAVLRELQKADQAVKAHEMAHLAAAGGYAKGGATYSYQRGPDGQNYAVGGEVQVDTSKEATPEATIQKMQIIRQAALAPADPSSQDQQVAAQATLQISESSKELMQLQRLRLPGRRPLPLRRARLMKERPGGSIRVRPQTWWGRTYPPPDSPSRAQKAYAAYANPLPSQPDRTGKGLDRIV